MKPLITAHRGGDCFGEENSLKAIVGAVQAGADIIELDVRKSVDGILFCYHGNFIEHLFPRVFNKTFAQLKRRYPSLITLREGTAAADKKILFLDIKDRTIGLEEIKYSLADFKGGVYLASNNFNYHRKTGSLPKKWKRVFNVGLNLNKRTFRLLRETNIDIVELFRWDFTRENIDMLRDHHITVALSTTFLLRSTYLRKCFEEKTEWVWLYDLPRLVAYKKELK